MQHRLHIVFAGGNIAEVARGITISVVVRDHDRLSRCKSVDIHAEENLRFDGEIDLHARLLRRVRRKQYEDTPIERLRASFFRKRNRKLRPICGRRKRGQRVCGQSDRKQKESKTEQVVLRNIHFYASKLCRVRKRIASRRRDEQEILRKPWLR